MHHVYRYGLGVRHVPCRDRIRDVGGCASLVAGFDELDAEHWHCRSVHFDVRLSARLVVEADVLPTRRIGKSSTVARTQSRIQPGNSR